MNRNVRSLLQQYVDPNIEIIKQRSGLLTLHIKQGQLPDFIIKRFEDIKLLALIGSDSTVMKLIPNFIEELLINILVSVKTSIRKEFYSNQRKIEEMSAKKIYADLKDMNVLTEQDIEFCDSYFGQSNVRNKEIHNKEIRIFESLGGIDLIDPDTGERKRAEQGVVDLIKSSPALLRSLNHNDRVSRVQFEMIRLFAFIMNNASSLSKLNNLPDKDMEAFLASQPKSTKILMKLLNKQPPSKVEKAIKENPEINSYQRVGNDSFELEYKSEKSAAEASLYFLPVTNGQFKMKPIE
ncbi:hypothetical protein KDJ21_002670 [Metabacillus litoralis]|uniref:hypothetical protein n=1 Tax=Metabacillus litoralis TaxID=152268 RepID=UPI001B96AB11|nr:hypothetical protein [Metabacillus litoralis]UHA60654.1 hypothetical protein KDJ21_002670 [Metabacillus litoralis]